MHELSAFGLVVFVIAGGFSLALVSSKLTERIRVPAPALFLLVAAAVSDAFPELNEHVSVLSVERLTVVALVIILFDGGMHVGWHRFRGSAIPISTLGILGTFGTAALMAVAAHLLLELSWTTSGLIGAALAPTDPAVMFSVLGKREVGGRTGTILEGESGANDPVGIALMLGMIQFATSDHGSIWIVVREFSLAMAVGLAIGIAGGKLLAPLMRVSLPSASFYPIRILAAAGVIYGATSVAHGSGFLAVFVAGILVGDAKAPFKDEVERFHSSLASLAEIAAFAGLGLTVDLSFVGHDWLWLKGLVLAFVLVLVARPIVVGLLLIPVDLRPGERLFVLWGGLKGAVPILLAAFALLENVDRADQIYALVFVAVAFSVIVQGSTIRFSAERLGVPMRAIEQRPWLVTVPLKNAPERVVQTVVSEGAPAAGKRIRDLELGEEAWISLLVRDGEPIQARGTRVLRPGDELVIVASPEQASVLRRLFGSIAS